MDTAFERQNDKKGLKLIRAYSRCSDMELTLTYICIAFSLLFSITGIVLTICLIYYPNSTDPIQMTQKIISIVSGFYLILQIFLLYFADEFGKNKVTLLEMYENYVYDFKPNAMMMRPIKEPQIHEWSEQCRKKNKAFKNLYFRESDIVNEDIIFKKQEKTCQKYFGLLRFAVSHFYSLLWVAVLSMLIAFLIMASMNPNLGLADVLVGIFIPSLSIITMIANSLKKYIVQRKAALSCISAIDELKKKK